MAIKKVNPELAFSDRLTDAERATLPRQGYRMLINAAMPEELQDPNRHKGERVGPRYAEISVHPQG
jgi:protein tyrosine phosphatase (PTP) superfamily phosphohydrolase (DUF442 family)